MDLASSVFKLAVVHLAFNMVIYAQKSIQLIMQKTVNSCVSHRSTLLIDIY